MEDYFNAKKKLFVLNSKKRIAVVNEDDDWGKRLIPELPMSTITFGLGPAALVRAERFKLNGPGIEGDDQVPGRTDRHRLDARRTATTSTTCWPPSPWPWPSASRRPSSGTGSPR